MNGVLDKDDYYFELGRDEPGVEFRSCVPGQQLLTV